MPDPHAPELGDWRCANAFWISGIGPLHLAQPARGVQTSVFESNGRRDSFQTPSGAALHLNNAWKAARRAHSLRERVTWNEGFIRDDLFERQADPASIEALFDFFEEAMLCAMSSLAAVEAFCNNALVSKVGLSYPVMRRKAVVLMTAQQIEEQVSTDEKLKRILPGVLNLSSPAGFAPLWSEYLRLKAVRDAVTHFKRRDESRDSTRWAEPTALHLLFNEDLFLLPETAMRLILHFFPTDAPRWMTNPQWKRPQKEAPPGAKTGATQTATWSSFTVKLR